MSSKNPPNAHLEYRSTREFRTLVTFIDFRKKYIGAFGGYRALEAFDQILDASPFVNGKGEIKSYPDRIDDPKVVRIASYAELEKVLADSRPTLAVVFRDTDTEASDLAYRAISKHSKKWGVLENKRTVRRVLQLFNPAPLLRMRLLNLLGIKTRFTADFLIVSSTAHCGSLSRKIRFKKILYTSHFDAVAVGDNPSQGGSYAVFLDQYLPFHREVSDRFGEHIAAELYYSQLHSYLTHFKKNSGVSRVIIAKHPNSRGEEDKHLSGYEAYRGATQALVRNALHVIGHCSNSLSYAELYGKPIRVVLFSCLPPRIQAKTRQRAHEIGCPIDSVDKTGAVRCIGGKSWWRPIRRQLFRRIFLRPDAPTLCELIESNQI